MSDGPPPPVPGGAPGGREPALTPPDVEAVLADFRSWLLQAAGAAPPPPDAAAAGSVDLHTLLAELTALRHEVHLQTRAARAQQEQNAETLRQLSQALAVLDQPREKGASSSRQGQDDALRPLLKT